MELSRIEKALRIAIAAHDGQVRKGEDVPYVTHPVMVALWLGREGFSDTVIAAALVHDVVEDSGYSLADIRQELGQEVADIVETVTHNDGLSWEEKKKGYAEAIGNGSVDAKAVALMDKIHNAEYLLASYAALGPAVWDRFKRGKDKKIWFEELMLSVFEETWDHPLIARYKDLIEELKKAD